MAWLDNGTYVDESQLQGYMQYMSATAMTGVAPAAAFNYGASQFVFPPSGAASMLSTAPQYTANPLMNMGLGLIVPPVMQAITGRPFTAPWVGQNMPSFDAMYSRNLVTGTAGSPGTFVTGSREPLMRMGQAWGNTLGNIASNFGLADEQQRQQLNAIGGSDAGVFAMQMASQTPMLGDLMRNINMGSPMVAYQDVFARRFQLAAAGNIPLVKDGKFNAEFEVAATQRANELFGEQFKQTYGVRDASGKFTGDFKATPNMDYTKGFQFDDIAGKLPAYMAARDFTVAGPAGAVGFRGASPTQQSTGINQMKDALVAAREVFETGDVQALLQAMEKLTQGNLPRVNVQQLKQSLTTMKGTAEALGITGQAMADITLGAGMNAEQAMGAAIGGNPNMFFSASGRMRGIGNPMAPGGMMEREGLLIAGTAVATGRLTPEGIIDVKAERAGFLNAVSGSVGARDIRTIEYMRQQGVVGAEDPAYKEYRRALATGDQSQIGAAANKIYGRFGDVADIRQRYVNNDSAQANMWLNTSFENRGQIGDMITDVATRNIQQVSSEVANANQEKAAWSAARLTGARINYADPRVGGARIGGMQTYLRGIADDASKPAEERDRARLLERNLGEQLAGGGVDAAMAAVRDPSYDRYRKEMMSAGQASAADAIMGAVVTPEAIQGAQVQAQLDTLRRFGRDKDKGPQGDAAKADYKERVRGITRHLADKQWDEATSDTAELRRLYVHDKTTNDMLDLKANDRKIEIESKAKQYTADKEQRALHGTTGMGEAELAARLRSPDMSDVSKNFLAGKATAKDLQAAGVAIGSILGPLQDKVDRRSIGAAIVDELSVTNGRGSISSLSAAAAGGIDLTRVPGTKTGPIVPEEARPAESKKPATTQQTAEAKPLKISGIMTLKDANQKVIGPADVEGTLFGMLFGKR